MQNKPQEVILHVPPAMWNKFRSAMLQARQNREEVIGFFFCQRQYLSDQIKYVPQAWIVPSPDCYEHQSMTGLVLKQSFHQYLFDTYLQKRSDLAKSELKLDLNNFPEDNYLSYLPKKDFWCDRNLDNLVFDREENHLNNTQENTALDVVHIHSHFGFETPEFSYTDDRHEAEYAKFLTSSLKHQPKLISGVFNESLDEYQFRIWDRQGIQHKPIEFYNSWFAINSDFANDKRTSYQIAASETELMFARQQVFGTGVQQQLRKLKVALVGCGGIGAVFAQQFGRLGVRNWVLIDGDRLETSNLNRMPGATNKMVEQGWYKVDYVKHLIEKVYRTDSNIKTLLNLKLTQTEIADADLIIVATDNHRSRQIAQELALKHTRPLMCLGTHIEIKPDKTPRMYCRVTVPPLGGGWCLMCGNIINLQQAALESAPQGIANVANQAGYIQGIGDPAVFWLNSICASTGVGIIHSLLSGFLNLDAGLDWIYDFPNSNWLKTDTQYLTTPDCYFCSQQYIL